MNYLKSEEWYLWRRHSNKKYPWGRYLNTGFLKSERKRINDVNGWMKNSQRVPYRANEKIEWLKIPKSDIFWSKGFKNHEKII